jgi:hypothetical protein
MAQGQGPARTRAVTKSWGRRRPVNKCAAISLMLDRRLKTSQRQKLVDRGQAVVYAAVAIPRCSKRSSIPERSFS